MPAVKEPLTEPIPGYRLIEPLGSGGFGEVWKCEAPGGLFKAIKFVYGDLDGLDSDSAGAEEELRAIERIKAIRHPFLLSMDRVECVDGELMIVTELADRNLHEVLLGYQKAGLPGIPRDELLGYLREAAEVLDLMNTQHGLQHLDIKPRNLFLVSNHVKVADFGLVNSLGAGGDQSDPKLGAVTPLYAAPEIFHGNISRYSDQYSLAVAYQEMLTGTLPFQGKNSRQLLLQHTKGEPDLRALPEEDRPIVGRALAKEAHQRFPSCTAFVRALIEAGAGGQVVAGQGPPAAAQEPNPAAETIKNKSGDTNPGRQRQAPTIAALAGHHFLENVGSSPLADVWKVLRPDGRSCLVRLVYGLGSRDARELEDAVVRLKALRHPALIPMEVVQSDPGSLVLVSDLIEETLRDRWQKSQVQRQPGIPRKELLGYLRAAAEAVDYLYQQHALHHLGLNPRNLLLDKGRLQLAEFGLVHLFWLRSGQPVATRNARYASPELFEGQAGRTCDQYSLAVIYQELLTGVHPFRGQSRLAGARAKARPDLAPLPAADRDAIARALDADPLQRWPSCTDLVRALEGEAAQAAPAEKARRDRFVERLRSAAPAAAPAVTSVSQDALNRILHDLIATAGGDIDANEPDALAPSVSGDRLCHRFRAGLPAGAARLKLDAFRCQLDGQLLRDDEERFAFQVRTPTNFWRQWIGRQPALEVEVHLSRPHALSATPIDVAVEIRALGCGVKRTAKLLEDVGAPLLENLRAYLLVNSEKRTQDRLLWPYPVQVCCVLSDGKVGPPIECRGKDISLSGIGFYLPHEIPTSQVCVNLPMAAPQRVISVPATLVRANRCADGWYDVGALFRLAGLKKSLPSGARS